MATETVNLGAVIRTARVAMGWQQKEFASILGMSQSRLSRIEMGKEIPSLAVLNRLSRYINPARLLPFSPLEEKEEEAP